MASFFRKWTEGIKRNSIEGMRKEAIKGARAQYNPNVMNAALDNAAYQAEFGIADDAMRARAVDATYRGVDSDTIDLAGGNAALAMASQEAQNVSRSERLANTMLGIDIEEERAILEGRESYANIMTQKNQIEAEREAAIHAANVQASAAKRQRNMQLLQAGIGIAGAVASGGLTGVLGGVGAAMSAKQALDGAKTTDFNNTFGEQMSNTSVISDDGIDVSMPYDINNIPISKNLPEQYINPRKNLPYGADYFRTDTQLNKKPFMAGFY